MLGAIVVNGYYKSVPYARQTECLLSEFAAKGIRTEVYENRKAVSVGEKFDFDFAVFLDKDINLAFEMENAGVRLFNSAGAIENADSKARTTLILQKNGVKIQPTVIGAKKYFYSRDDGFLKSAAEKFGFPMIVKASYGSLGKQVFLADNAEQLADTEKSLGSQEIIFQKFRAESRGRSVRIIVIGGRAVGGIKLVNKIDFRSNAAEGGKGVAFPPDKSYAGEAEKAAKALGLDYCGVDLFCDEPVVIEVNSNAYFDEFSRITGINVAQKYVEYIMETMKI